MYFSIFVRGAGHPKHLEVRSPRKEDQEQTCGAHGESVVHAWYACVAGVTYGFQLGVESFCFSVALLSSVAG